MSSASTNPAGAALGVGSIIGESFTILFRHFLAVLILSLVPTLLSVVISGLMNGWGVALGYGGDVVAPDRGYFMRFALSLVAQIALSGITTALLVQMAYDAKLGRPLQLGKYIGPAIGAVIPLSILGLASGILVGLGTLALILPGLLIYAVFAVMPAAVVIEKAGFGGLGRSAELTRGYRWPIAGAAILLWIVAFLVSMAAMFVVGLIIAAIGPGSGGIIFGVLGFTAITALAAGLSSIAVALIYARLREIKEGTSVQDIAAVFE
jgi:hypothetical protein